MTAKTRIEAKLAEFPICDYAFLKVSDLTFKEEVRYICKTECSRYGTSWACPPAVGTVEECRERCSRFTDAFLFTTMTEVPDIEDLEATLETRCDHEAVTRRVRDIFREECGEILVLSTESCAICAHCAYPDAACRHPAHMFPCVESYGILVTELAEKSGITFIQGGNLVTWFSLILFMA